MESYRDKKMRLAAERKVEPIVSRLNECAVALRVTPVPKASAEHVLLVLNEIEDLVHDAVGLERP